jgi:hypothetical protein
VERMLAGEFNPEGLDRLLTNLRFKSYGAASLAEVGHFLAHNDERDKGPITQEARDFFAVMRFHLPVLGAETDLSNMPTSFAPAMRATFRQLDDQYTKRNVGLKKKVAEHVLKGALDKYAPRPGGRLAPTSDLTSDERAVLLTCLRGGFHIHLRLRRPELSKKTVCSRLRKSRS